MASSTISLKPNSFYFNDSSVALPLHLRSAMTTRITQVNGNNGSETTLRVEGSLRLVDAELLEAIYTEVSKQYAGTIAIDLAGTNFLDSDSASVLCRLRDKGAELVGLHFFIQRIIEAAENA